MTVTVLKHGQATYDTHMFKSRDMMYGRPMQSHQNSTSYALSAVREKSELMNNGNRRYEVGTDCLNEKL